MHNKESSSTKPVLELFVLSLLETILWAFAFVKGM